MAEGSNQLSDEQVRAILKRATEVERTQKEQGLTIGELREVADEVGIPSEALSRAIREVSRSSAFDRGAAQKWGRHRETEFVSATASDEDVAWLLRLLDRLGQIDGKISYEEDFLRWNSSEGYQVELLCRPSETHLRIETEDRPHLIKTAAIFVTGGAAWAVALAPLLGPTTPDVVLTLLTGAGVGGASWAAYWKVRSSRIRERASKLARGISDALQLITDQGKEEE